MVSPAHIRGSYRGIIGYFAVRHDDPRLARRLLYVGIGMTAAGIVISLVINLFAPQDFYRTPSI